MSIEDVKKSNNQVIIIGTLIHSSTDSNEISTELLYQQYLSQDIFLNGKIRGKISLIKKNKRKNIFDRRPEFSFNRLKFVQYMIRTMLRFWLEVFIPLKTMYAELI